MSLRSESIQRWWPATQSLDLVQGDVEEVAAAVRAEVARFLGNTRLAESWKSFVDLTSALSLAGDFTNIPTVFLVLPTKSDWSVLWNNSFLCDGYDSLCWCLTTNHHLTTLHWSAHDEPTSFQPGASFTHRSWCGSLVERTVSVACNDGRWRFDQVGDPLAEEDVSNYRARRIRDRLNERLMATLLRRLEAAPWSEEFYAFGQRYFTLQRTDVPSTVLRRKAAEVVKGAG
jgi:hypothetical protein